MPANDYDYDDLDRLGDVEYLSGQLEVEGFVMDNLGNRPGHQVLRIAKEVNCTTLKGSTYLKLPKLP